MNKSAQVAKTFYSAAELAALSGWEATASPIFYSLRGPRPQMFLVIANRDRARPGPTIRTVTIAPLSLQPYTMAVTIPIDDAVVSDSLANEDAECVLATPTRDMLRQITICSQRLPRGLSEAALARFTLVRSPHVRAPSIADCPVNFECRVEHTEVFYGYLLAFLRVVGASIDDSILFWPREQIVSFFPTNDVDSVLDSKDSTVKRVAVLGDLLACPTFPCGPKQGCSGSFDGWVGDLRDEGYLTASEGARLLGWHTRWQEVFPELQSPERAALRATLTEACRLMAHEQWDALRALIAASP